MRPKRPKNIIHEIFPAEKRLAKIDELEIELDLKRHEMPITEYVRAKRALTIRRLTEFRRIEKNNGWNEIEDACETGPPANEDIPEPVETELETPRARRYLHYMIFWGWLFVISQVICWISPYLKK